MGTERAYEFPLAEWLKVPITRCHCNCDLNAFSTSPQTKFSLTRSTSVIKYAALINMSFNVSSWLRSWHNIWLNKQFLLGEAALNGQCQTSLLKQCRTPGVKMPYWSYNLCEAGVVTKRLILQNQRKLCLLKQNQSNCSVEVHGRSSLLLESKNWNPVCHVNFFYIRTSF